MTTFIEDVLKDLLKQSIPLTHLTFIIPSKRAGAFLKHHITSVINQPIFSPQIISIEEFVEHLSQLKSISNTEILFEFYSIYRKLTPKNETDTFDVFSKWAQILIQDFNEIDRYLIPQKQIFNYLSAIKEIEHNHWSLEDNSTDFIKKYLSFWNKLHLYYNEFRTHLLEKNIGYQGLIYREAVENLEFYIQNNPKKQHVFLGFNALNTAEKTIIQELLQHNLAQIFWDIDQQFINNDIHSAGLFTRQYKKNWPYFRQNDFNWITKNYEKEKNIYIYGVPKNIGQAKHIGSLLKKINSDKAGVKNTALILGDENLLIPILNSIPESIPKLNITMGFPLKSIPIAALFEQLFSIHKIPSKAFYFKDVISILSHQSIKGLFNNQSINFASKIIRTIRTNNIIYVSKEQLIEIIGEPNILINVLFDNWENSPSIALEKCSELILILKNHLDQDKSANLLSLEYIYRYNELFNELKRLDTIYNHIITIAALHSVYKELLSSETLDFQGEPLEGLQVMGMLESRVLDFETVIISSLNEGVLPAGKSNNSFIPFDVKIENKMPTYKEKDAVYTYHFYRLLQRAKHIYIVYNTETDSLNGGEKSRFITQLELHPIHNVHHAIIAPKVPSYKKKLTIIKKDNEVLNDLKKIAEKGFSPSSLTNYIRNPLDFYYEKILKIKTEHDVEEHVAANTLGTIIHKSLEDLYIPLKGTDLNVVALEQLFSKIDPTVSSHFKKEYKDGDINKGKNLIVFEIAKHYISTFISLEIKDIKQGNAITIVDLESESRIPIKIKGVDFPVYLSGTIDRIDTYNGVTRIIDYKTGKVNKNNVEVSDWDLITTDYESYSKSFQVLMYVYLLQKGSGISLPVEAGIITFKDLNSGVLKFTKKHKQGNKNQKDTLITEETLNNFEAELKKLILEICDPNVNFIEKEV